MWLTIGIALGIYIIVVADFLSANDKDNIAIKAGLSYAALCMSVALVLTLPTGKPPEGFAIDLLYVMSFVIGYCSIHWYAMVARDMLNRRRSKVTSAS